MGPLRAEEEEEGDVVEVPISPGRLVTPLSPRRLGPSLVRVIMSLTTYSCRLRFEPVHVLNGKKKNIKCNFYLDRCQLDGGGRSAGGRHSQP